jgi:FkbM family methyltransferase
MKEGDVVWDVGANIGMVTAAVAREFPQSSIFSFEPNPFLCQSLQALFCNAPHVTVLPFALSDADADVQLLIPRGKSVGASIRGVEYLVETANLKPSDLVQRPVTAVRGDSLLRREPAILPPKIVKIDVEGHEAAVIAGLTDTISRFRPTIFFEHLYLSDQEIARLVPSSYSLRSVSDSSGALTSSFDRSVGHNSVLLPDSLDDRLDARNNH